ncbi:MAG: C69 family dipeptidase [Candidatus Binatia bacterium]
MCDTLCVVGKGRSLFAKNSDRPHDEPQVVEAFPRRPAGGTLRTQYLEISDEGAFAMVGSRPVWLWGFEHGVNEHRVAIGNEAVYTTGHVADGPPALIGMDLVRLGLERARSAREAVEVMTELLGRHGQAGDCYQTGGSYDSSFLVCDPAEAWVVETSGRSAHAERFDGGTAISNRLSIREDWRDTSVGTSFADVRLQASMACVARGADATMPRDLVRHLRDHGGHEGLPPSDEFTVCMHIRGAVNTTSAMVCDLPADPGEPARAWVALGSPCTSVFVPIFPPDVIPPELGDEKTWERFRELRDRAERDDDTLAGIRSILDPLEDELWTEADAFATTAWDRVAKQLDALG